MSKPRKDMQQMPKYMQKRRSVVDKRAVVAVRIDTKIILPFVLLLSLVILLCLPALCLELLKKLKAAKTKAENKEVSTPKEPKQLDWEELIIHEI